MSSISREASKTEEFLTLVWREAVGEKIASHSKPMRLSHKKLIIHVESAAWMNELTYLKDKIKMQCQQAFSRHQCICEDVIFRLGIR
jgi:predicted nucleic acid-binding Zn ribbon protein